MTNWQPDLESSVGPRYLAIAEALALDVESGRLPAGERLPTHRDLAWRLGVTVGTVTRAYAEAERRGLIAGEVGRGTFVREQLPSAPPSRGKEEASGGLIDLSYNFPAMESDQTLLSGVLAEVSNDPQLLHHLGYSLGLGRDGHREAACDWLALAGLEATPEEVAVTAGAQHAMLLAVAALTRPGDVILTESLTFFGIKSIAEVLELQLHGVPLDEQGLVPEALEATLRSSGARVLYCIPTLQNPTTSIMPESRRHRIAEICERNGVWIIEDDIYGLLLETPPKPLTSLLPDQAVYVTSLSKCLAPGLRIGYLRAPKSLQEDIAKGMRASMLMPSAFMAETATRLIRSGKARQATLAKGTEAEARQAMARAILPEERLIGPNRSFHAWLPLPRPWRHEDFTAEAKRQGVLVGSARVFAVGRQPVPHAVRLCLHAAKSRKELKAGLETLAGILATEPQPEPPLV